MSDIISEIAARHEENRMELKNGHNGSVFLAIKLALIEHAAIVNARYNKMLKEYGKCHEELLQCRVDLRIANHRLKPGLTCEATLLSMDGKAVSTTPNCTVHFDNDRT